MIELIRVKMHHTPQIFALATMVDLRSNFSRHMIGQISDTFSQHIFDHWIHMNVACRESQARGVPLLHYKPKAKASLDHGALAAEIIRRFVESNAVIAESRPAPPAESVRSHVRDFILMAPEASEVHLVGDFNEWRLDTSSRLWKSGKGVWQKRLLLAPGRYRYKFVIDGKWTPDPQNPLAEPNTSGEIDSVIEIE